MPRDLRAHHGITTYCYYYYFENRRPAAVAAMIGVHLVSTRTRKGSGQCCEVSRPNYTRIVPRRLRVSVSEGRSTVNIVAHNLPLIFKHICIFTDSSENLSISLLPTWSVRHSQLN